MSAKKFTFKTEKATGRYRSFYPDTHTIKLDKKQVGSISDEKGHKIMLQVIKDGVIIKDDNPNCDWKNIILKREFDSVQAAKEFLN